MNKIVFIGNFAGGSFGQAGDPFRTYPYFALSSDIEAFAKSRDAIPMIAFNSKLDAESRLASLSQGAADEAASALKARSDRQHRLVMGRNIRAAIELYLGTPVRQLRWTDHPPEEALSRREPAGGCDAIADGRSFRVWIGSTGQAVRILEQAPRRDVARV
jgi:hypothetical protein